MSVHAENKSVLEIFYHAKECMCAAEFNKWSLLPLSENIKSPLDILRQLQKRGEQSVLMHIFNYILEKYETSDMLIDFINIYIDTVHLGGEYERAVNICNNYLNKYKKDEIASNKQLLKMNIRKLHHSMFFMPVNGLLKEAKELIKDINSEKYIDEYNEILFLLGGNLGILSGDFQTAYRWITLSKEWAEEHKMELVNNVISINMPIEDINSL